VGYHATKTALHGLSGIKFLLKMTWM